MILVSILIAVVTLSVYWKVIGFSFIELDDPSYVTNNLFVEKGIILDGIKWAFLEVYADYWYTLTLLS
jgi:protein O-mannosyl-transferase